MIVETIKDFQDESHLRVVVSKLFTALERSPGLDSFLRGVVATDHNGHCGVVVATSSDKATLHLLVELQGNMGMSVTNCIERVEQRVRDKWGPASYVVETYEGRPGFDRVTFDGHTRWKRVSDMEART